MAWTRVQGFEVHDWTGTNVASINVTLGASVAVGDTILLHTNNGASGSDPVVNGAVTDQLGNTYTLQAACASGAAGFQWEDGFSCIVAFAGTPTITFTVSGGPQPFIAMQGDHFTGSDAASVVEGSAGLYSVTPGTGADLLTSGNTAATTTDGCLVWAAAFDQVGAGVVVDGTGFTAGNVLNATTGQITEYKTQTVHGVTAGTFTDATRGNLDNYSVMVIAVRPAAAGGAPPSRVPARVRAFTLDEY
jgi:hypothetical protein